MTKTTKDQRIISTGGVGSGKTIASMAWLREQLDQPQVTITGFKIPHPAWVVDELDRLRAAKGLPPIKREPVR
jgi:hypothetical protein